MPSGKSILSFISISGPILFSKWLGESEKALHHIFKKAKQSAPCILFFDEIEALGMTRGTGSESGAVERMASQFFHELDNLSDLSQVMVLGATNRIDLLDPALTRAGRLEFILPFPLPEENDRMEIFQVHTAERPLAPDVDLQDLARRTEGMSGSQIAQVCRAAALAPITEIVKGPEEARSRKLSLRASHFHRAIEEGGKKGAPPC